MRHNEKGFTLLEIIAAMTILAVGILTLVQLFSGGLNQASQADRYLNGVYLAQQQFAQLELDNFQSETLEGEFEGHEDYRWQLEVLPYESTLNDEEAGIQIEQLTLRVFWQDKGEEKEVQLVSLKTQGETHTAPADQLVPSIKGAASAAKAPPAPKIKNLNPSETQ